jgi:arginyl-tRNA--protein-N-Asp/Glu arginylyltransferase
MRREELGVVEAREHRFGRSIHDCAAFEMEREHGFHETQISHEHFSLFRRYARPHSGA